MEECPTCGNEYSDKTGLHTHYKSDNNDCIGFECPTCEASHFTNERGVAHHHAMVHGERLSDVVVTCDNCGRGFSRSESQIEQSENNFCDHDCYGEYISNEYSGRDSWNWKGGRVSATCDNCGDTFRRQESQLEGSERNYCSRECWDDHRGEVINGPDHPNYSQVKVECHTCGETLQRPKSRVEKYEYQFCNVDCMGRWKSSAQTGESHPNWKGGWDAQYGPSWTEELKETIRKNDGYKCRVCGIENEDHQRKNGQSLHVHHIRPVRAFEDQSEAHVEDNLITLCQRCHSKWEGIPLQPISV